MKGAAALALGGVAVGNLGAYLPALLAGVRSAVGVCRLRVRCPASIVKIAASTGAHAL